MITALLSTKELKDEILNQTISKKLDLINNIQMAVDKKNEIIVYPVDYPSSINSLLRVLSIADRAMFVLNEEISGLDAEIALSIENSNINDGVVVFSDASDINSFSKFFSNFKLGKFRQIKLGDTIPKESAKKSKYNFSYVSIDKHFIVKGIGNVIIGFNLGAEIRKGDRFHLIPSMKEVTIKSIQLMDVDVQSAANGQHVGLALNNVAENDMENNYAISSLSEISEDFQCVLKQSSFYKIDPFLSKGLTISFLGKNLSVGLEKTGENLRAKFNKPMVKLKEGHLIVDSSLAAGKNRVVGRLEIL